MCKILVIPHIPKDCRIMAVKFMLQMAKPMSIGNDDGLGYMGVTDENELVGEKWRYNNKAFNDRRQMSATELGLFKRYSGIIHPPEDIYRCYGGKSWTNTDLKTMCMHTRFATCGKSIQNTHPFFTENHALIHNGVISNPNRAKMKQSTCDSEVILNEYIDQGVVDDIKKIQTVANQLSGYYACAVYARTSYGEWILDVFKETSANLSGVFIPKLKTMVFTTDPTDVTEACKRLKWKTSRYFKVISSVINRFDIDTGNITASTEFKKLSAISNYDDSRWGGSSFGSSGYRGYNSSANPLGKSSSNGSSSYSKTSLGGWDKVDDADGEAAEQADRDADLEEERTAIVAVDKFMDKLK